MFASYGVARMKRPPEGFHEVYGAADAAGLSPEEVAEERRARGVEVNGKRWRKGPRVAAVKNPFDETLRTLGLWDRVETVCREHGVRPMELGEESKTKRLHAARVKVYLMLRDLSWGYKDIGLLFDRDESSVCAALKPKRIRK